MKKLLYVLTGLCLLAGVFAGCEKNPLEETGGDGSGSGGGTGGGSSQKGTIEGIVTSKDTGKPLLLASVQLLSTEKLTLTDTAGSFTLNDIEPGTYKLQVKRNGYADYTSGEIKVEGGKTVRHNVKLETIKSDLQILDADGTAISELNLGNSSRGTFLLQNAGEAIVEWEIPKLATDWIAGFSKQSGKLAPGAVDTVMLTIERSKLEEGENEATVYIGTNVGDKKLVIKAGVELSFCLADSYGNEILDLDMSSMDQCSFKIKNTGSGALTWTVGAIEVNWLTFVGERSGTLSAGESESRTLKVDRTRLEEGEYETALIFQTNAGTKSLLVKTKVEMSYQLVNAWGAEISGLDLGKTPQGVFRIKNTGSGVLSWEISSNAEDWLLLNGATQGKIQPNDAATIDLTVDLLKVSEGTNETSLHISSAAGDKQLPVRFTVYMNAVVSDYAETVGDIELQMVAVHGGVFNMGATEEQGSDAKSDEYPVHQVMLDGFYIGKYEVTQAQWKAVMGTNPSMYKGDDSPVEMVRWNEAVQFCEKLSEMTGKTYRLPTEAEWEYAARGGNESQHYKYAGSNDLDEVAWYGDSYLNPSHPVGTKKANELGIYDMSGNIYEWCSDRYGSYSSSPAINPQGPSSGTNRVTRGGSWCHTGDRGRVSSRIDNKPNEGYYNVGFRVVREP